MVLKYKKGWDIKATTIWKLAKKCQITNPLAASKHEALKHYHQAKSSYYSLKPQYELLWAKFLSAHLQDHLLSDQHQQAIAKMVQLEYQ